jgi:DNA adenine methylase
MWAGGKNKMLKKYQPFMPKNVHNYCEPFFGGGAMFIHLMTTQRPTGSITINDKNKDIINIYRCVRDEYKDFTAHVDVLQNKYMPLDMEERKKYYYEVREDHAWKYQEWSNTQQSATLYFLMKTGFNGIWQINKNTNNRFGTPAGLVNQKKEVYSKEILSWWNKTLQGVEIKSEDWQDVCQDDDECFFFFDPPYRNCFADYNQAFSDKQLLELIDFADRQSSVFLCNRADDDWFEGKTKSLNYEYLPVTYTAGRRKKTKDGHEAKPAREILLYKDN